MRSYKSRNTFFSKMKKKPLVQKVIDNIDDYTTEELLALRGTTYPKWIREELVQYKARAGKSAEEQATEFASLMPTTTVEIEEYATYRYTGPDVEVTNARNTFKTTLQETNLIILLTKSNNECIIKVEYDVCKISHAQYMDVMLHSEYIGMKTINDYNIAIRDYLNNKY